MNNITKDTIIEGMLSAFTREEIKDYTVSCDEYQCLNCNKKFKLHIFHYENQYFRYRCSYSIMEGSDKIIPAYCECGSESYSLILQGTTTNQ